MAKASSTTKVVQSELTKKAKDKVPEGRGFVASSNPVGGEAPASVRHLQNGSEDANNGSASRQPSPS